MSLGKRIRLNRVFSHSSGRLCSLAVDHFIGYQRGLPKGLVNVPKTLRLLAPLRPDAVTMLKGMAKGVWTEFAGLTPLIIQSMQFTPDDAIIERIATAEEVLSYGGDAMAVAIGVRGPQEGRYLKLLTGAVEECYKWGLPVIAHIYPRDYSDGPRIVFDPENIMWAVRAGIECGADVIKVPYTGDVTSFREIVATSPVPVVAAGGPQCKTLLESLKMMAAALRAGARGATIGRNIWGADDPVAAMRAFMMLIHGECGPEDALKRAEAQRKTPN